MKVVVSFVYWIATPVTPIPGTSGFFGVGDAVAVDERTLVVAQDDTEAVTSSPS